MRTLVFGAGPLGSLYTYFLSRAGKDVTLLARGQRYDWIKTNGLVLANEITGAREESSVRVVNELRQDDEYDLAVILIRKNRLLPVFTVLAENARIGSILFMGNNALGFDEYFRHLPKEKLLFGFPGAGGGIREHVVYYADRESPRKKRRAITIGEIDGRITERTRAITSHFETAGVPVDQTQDIDGWLKYHVALVSPLVNALYKHNCDNYALAKDTGTIRTLVRAAKEGGRVVKALGHTKRQPFRFNLFYWLPEVMMQKAVQALLESKFAEVAFAVHAKAARDEMKELADEFQSLVERTNIETPSIRLLKSHVA